MALRSAVRAAEYLPTRSEQLIPSPLLMLLDASRPQRYKPVPARLVFYAQTNASLNLISMQKVFNEAKRPVSLFIWLRGGKFVGCSPRPPSACPAVCLLLLLLLDEVQIGVFLSFYIFQVHIFFFVFLYILSFFILSSNVFFLYLSSSMFFLSFFPF